jgi:hypothetical protein
MARFDIGQGTLTDLRQQTSVVRDDLGSLVKELIRAAEPLEGRFSGSARTAFDAFKARADEISASLGSSLGAILSGQRGLEAAFASGEQQMIDSTQAAQSAAAYPIT